MQTRGQAPWPSLKEIGQEYLVTAAKLQLARERMRRQIDRTGRTDLTRDLKLTEQMLRQTREVANLAAHYYERGYFRDRRYTV